MENLMIALWSGDRFGGRKRTLNYDYVGDLGYLSNFNDVTCAIGMHPLSSHPALNDTVTFYQDVWFGGKSLTLGVGSYSSLDIIRWNKTISSYRFNTGLPLGFTDPNTNQSVRLVPQGAGKIAPWLLQVRCYKNANFAPPDQMEIYESAPSLGTMFGSDWNGAIQSVLVVAGSDFNGTAFARLWEHDNFMGQFMDVNPTTNNGFFTGIPFGVSSIQYFAS